MATCPLCGQREPDTAARCSACGKELQPPAQVAQPAPMAPPRVRAASAFKGTLVMPAPAPGAAAPVPPSSASPAPAPAPVVAAPAPPPPASAMPVPPAAAVKVPPTFKRPALGATMIGGMVAPPIAPPSAAGVAVPSAAPAKNPPAPSTRIGLDKTMLGLTSVPEPATPTWASAPEITVTVDDTIPAPPLAQSSARAEVPMPAPRAPMEKLPAARPEVPRLDVAPAAPPATRNADRSQEQSSGVLWLVIGFVGTLALAAVAVLAAKFMGLL